MKKINTGDSHVLWLQRGWQPVFIGFVPSQRAWDRQMKKFGLAGKEEYPNLTVAGHCRWFENSMDGDSVVLISFNREQFETASTVQRIGLVVHECVHAWQFICRDNGIKEPDQETEAYAIMALVQNTLGAIEQAWGVEFACQSSTPTSGASGGASGGESKTPN